MKYEDILYEEKNRVATITINRPKVHNAFRPRTCMELIDAFLKAGWNEEIGAIVLLLGAQVIAEFERTGVTDPRNTLVVGPSTAG